MDRSQIEDEVQKTQEVVGNLVNDDSSGIQLVLLKDDQDKRIPTEKTSTDKISSPSTSTEKEESDAGDANIEKRILSNKNEGAEEVGENTKMIETRDGVVENTPQRSSSSNHKDPQGNFSSIRGLLLLASLIFRVINTCPCILLRSYLLRI